MDKYGHANNAPKLRDQPVTLASIVQYELSDKGLISFVMLFWSVLVRYIVSWIHSAPGNKNAVHYFLSLFC